MKKFEQIRLKIGTRLKTERERHGLSREELGERIGVGRYAVMKYENGVNSPTAEHLNLLEQIDFDVYFITTGRHATLSKKDRETFCELFEEILKLAQVRPKKPSMKSILTATWMAFDFHNSGRTMKENVVNYQEAMALILSE